MAWYEVDCLDVSPMALPLKLELGNRFSWRI